MTTFPEIRVLVPGVTEAQDNYPENDVDPEITLVEQDASPGFRIAMHRQAGQTSYEEEPLEETLESWSHDRIEIGTLLDTRLRMRGSLTLEMEQEGEFYIAKCDELNEFGYDYDPIGAVQDIRATIAELYWELKENQDRLGADLAQTWQKLSQLVYEA